MEAIEQQIQKIVDAMEDNVATATIIRDRSIPDGRTYCTCHAVILALEPRIHELKQLLKQNP